MIATPIWDISVIAKPWVKKSGSTAMNRAVAPQITQRARLRG